MPDALSLVAPASTLRDLVVPFNGTTVLLPAYARELNAVARVELHLQDDLHLRFGGQC
jgi:hypothetical protein